MKEEKYNEALASYGRAIALDASNPIYYCNRAAAYSRLGEFQKAVDDCNQALRYDANYGKAYGRLCLAYSKMNRHKEAIDAYKNALRIEPDNQDYKNNMEVTQQRLEEQQSSSAASAGPGLGGPLETRAYEPGNTTRSPCSGRRGRRHPSQTRNGAPAC